MSRSIRLRTPIGSPNSPVTGATLTLRSTKKEIASAKLASCEIGVTPADMRSAAIWNLGGDRVWEVNAIWPSRLELAQRKKTGRGTVVRVAHTTFLPPRGRRTNKA